MTPPPPFMKLRFMFPKKTVRLRRKTQAGKQQAAGKPAGGKQPAAKKGK